MDLQDVTATVEGTAVHRRGVDDGDDSKRVLSTRPSTASTGLTREGRKSVQDDDRVMRVRLADSLCSKEGSRSSIEPSEDEDAALQEDRIASGFIADSAWFPESALDGADDDSDQQEAPADNLEAQIRMLGAELLMPSAEEGRRCQRRKSFFPGGSLGSACFNLTNTILGSGTLAVPFAMRSSGFVLGHVIMGLLLLVSNVSTQFLVRASDIAGHASKFNSYESLAYRTFGMRGVALVAVAVCGGGFGLIMANLIFISQSVVSFIYAQPAVNSPALRSVIVIVAVCLVFPLCLFKRISTFRYASLLSLATTGYISGFMAYRFYCNPPRPVPDLEARNFHWGLPPDYDLLATVSILISAFSCHMSTLPVYERLRERTIGRMASAVNVALGVALVIYETVGLSGYSLFGNSTDSNILNNFWGAGENGWALRLASGAVGITLTASCPMALWPMRSCLLSLWILNKRRSRRRRKRRGTGDADPDAHPPPRHVRRRAESIAVQASFPVWAGVTFAIVASAAVAAALFPIVSLALVIVGSVGGSLICFILPPLFWLKLHNEASCPHARYAEDIQTPVEGEGRSGDQRTTSRMFAPPLSPGAAAADDWHGSTQTKAVDVVGKAVAVALVMCGVLLGSVSFIKAIIKVCNQTRSLP